MQQRRSDDEGSPGSATDSRPRDRRSEAASEVANHVARAMVHMAHERRSGRDRRRAEAATQHADTLLPERTQPTARTRRDAEQPRTVLIVSERGDVWIDSTATRDELATALGVVAQALYRARLPVCIAYMVEVML